MLQIHNSSALIAQQSHQQSYVPLKRVSVQATIRTFAADVTIKQVFRNDTKTLIEAVYCFPIEEQAAVYAFVAYIDNREIVAHLKEKKKAQYEYNDALQEGHGAYLLEQDEKSQDNFVINVGALPPSKECKISISYVSELDLVHSGRKIRFVVPATIAPRYDRDKGGIASPAGTTSKYVQTSSYTIEFHCRVDKIGISRVSSLSHPIRVDLSHQDVYVIEFAQKNTHLDRDILIDIDLDKNRSNTIVAAEPSAVMASFIPTEEDCRRVMNNAETTNEFIFILDCSGSMEEENKIDLARQAMLLFLKSLPVHCHFNIVRFGSDYHTLFQDVTAVYNEENARKAEQLTNQMQADLGGTKLLEPLQWLEKDPPSGGRSRQIFLLTDGEIYNVDRVVDFCRSMSTSTRIFSFGLGHSPSRSLVKGLARATNGRFVFIPPYSSVDVHVGDQLKRALKSSITNVQVKWNLGTSVRSVPTKTSPVYANDRLIVYALVNDSTSLIEDNFSVELHTDEHRLSKMTFTRMPYVNNDSTIARLAAKALILELQHAKFPLKNMKGSLQTRFQDQRRPSTTVTVDEKEARKKRIVELSLKHNILSPHTAFVGVEKRTNASNADMILREVPIQISADDQHSKISYSMSNHATADSNLPCRRSVISTLKRRYAAMKTHNEDILSQIQINRQIERQLRTDARPSTIPSHLPSPPPLRRLDRLRNTIRKSRLFNYFFSGSMLATSKHACEEEQRSKNPIEGEEEEEIWPTGDENIVRYLINKQKFDGLWDLNAKNIQQLTGKSLSSFPHYENLQVIVSAIVVVTLEIRFASLSTLWHGVVRKARQRLVDLLNNDKKKFDSLLAKICEQF